MAKITSPFSPGYLTDIYKKVVRSYELGSDDIAKFAAEMPTPSPEWIAEQSTLFTDAQAAWSRLATWKKVRWSLCAINTYGDPTTITGIKGQSGYTMYIRSWLEQKPAADHQPISPCSARVTDPDASPWDYQP
jgi:hypothetical protein